MNIISYEKQMPDGSVGVHYINLDQVSTFSVVEKDDKTIIYASVGNITHVINDSIKVLDTKMLIKTLMNFSLTSPMAISSIIHDCNVAVSNKKRK